MADSLPSPLDLFKKQMFKLEILSEDTEKGTITVKCPTCMQCNETGTLTVSKEGYDKWQAGTFVQTAFPKLGSNDREMLLTGIHNACWDKMWEEDEDDEENDEYGNEFPDE